MIGHRLILPSGMTNTPYEGSVFFEPKIPHDFKFSQDSSIGKLEVGLIAEARIGGAFRLAMRIKTNEIYQRLINEGYIKEQPMPLGRCVHLTIAEKGREVLREAGYNI